MNFSKISNLRPEVFTLLWEKDGERLAVGSYVYNPDKYQVSDDHQTLKILNANDEDAGFFDHDLSKFFNLQHIF